MSSCRKCGAWMPNGLIVCRNCGDRTLLEVGGVQPNAPEQAPAATSKESKPVVSEASKGSGLGTAFWLYWVGGSMLFAAISRFFDEPSELRAIILLNLFYASWAAFMVWTAAGRSDKGIGILARVFISVAWTLGVSLGILTLVALEPN